MKKLIAAIATVIAAAAVASGATAAGPFYSSSEFLCGILLPDGGTALTYDSTFTISANGSATLKCNAWTEGSGQRVVLSNKNTGALCAYFDSNVGLFLPNWKSVHGANGQVVLTCHGQYDTNAAPEPTAARAAGGAGTG